jgi:hypothetical protein
MMMMVIMSTTSQIPHVPILVSNATSPFSVAETEAGPKLRDRDQDHLTTGINGAEAQSEVERVSSGMEVEIELPLPLAVVWVLKLVVLGREVRGVVGKGWV